MNMQVGPKSLFEKDFMWITCSAETETKKVFPRIWHLAMPWKYVWLTTMQYHALGCRNL